MIFFTETVHICRIKFQKKNRGKKWMEISAIKGGEGGPTPIGKCHFKFSYFPNREKGGRGWGGEE